VTWRRADPLWRDQTGATIVEFALILPALMVVLFGLFDLSYNMYTAQMLQGAIQGAARDSTIEGAGGSEAAIDARVTRAVHALAPGATLSFNRKAYASFSGVNRPEDYDDTNANATCDNGEPFEDANGNGSWDLDPGSAGFGGARDAVLYSVSVTYKRTFPIAVLIPGQTDSFTLVSRTVLRNQPYGATSNAVPPVGACT
jgi:Flp pilus assembly protein TadG